MKIEGKLIKSGKWWAVEIPLLLVHTQGKTKRQAYLMAADADIPGPNQVFFYLIRAENDCAAGGGSLGTQTDLTPRTATACE